MMALAYDILRMAINCNAPNNRLRSFDRFLTKTVFKNTELRENEVGNNTRICVQNWLDYNYNNNFHTAINDQKYKWEVR